MKHIFCKHATSELLIILAIFIQQLTFWGCSNEGIVQTLNDNSVLPNGYEERYYQGMRYGLFIPSSYDSTRSYPLIVSLHGSGDTVSWDLGWYHDPIQSVDPCFVLTPKSLVRSSGWGTSWLSTHTPDMRKTLDVVDSLKAEFNLNTNRLYIYGTSMGGYGVYSVLTKNRGLFAAAFSICGGGDSKLAAIVAQTPLWIFHGSVDNVVPVQLSRDMYQAILSADGKQVRYTEYAGVGHAAWTPAWQEPTLEGWLLSQEKGVAHGSPDMVVNFRHEMIRNTQVKLLWEPPSDHSKSDNQIWYYMLFRDHHLLAELDNIHTTFVDSTAASTSTYLYNISAVNYFFKESFRTLPISVTIP